jgi:dTDP-4-amino-4,6-dideoxygalactose transaminase
MDPDALKATVDGVAAVMPVHLYGQPAELEPIGSVAATAGVPLDRGRRQAHGADYTKADGTRSALARGIAGVSTTRARTWSIGDARSITDDGELFERCGSARSRQHRTTTAWSAADRIDTLQAAVLTGVDELAE